MLSKSLPNSRAASLHRRYPASPVLPTPPPPSRLSADFPVLPVIRPTLLPRFPRRDEEGFSSCLARPRHRAVATTPPECRSASASLRYAMLPSSFGLRTRPPGLALSGPPLRSLALRPGDSPTTLYDGRVDGLQGISFLPPCHPNYGVLALSPAGLSPAERASLCWTHNRACGFPAPGSRTRSCRRPRKAFACSAVWSVRTLLELLGVSTSLHVLASFLRCSRTEAPSLRRHYPASPVLRASPPPRRPKLVLADSRLARARHRRGFPCCCCLPLARMPPPIPRRNRSVPASLASRPLSAFPVLTAGRLPHYPFRGLLSVHFALRPACSLNRPQAILLHRSASVQFVTSLHRSDCFRLERQLPGGIRTRWDTAPFHGARKHSVYGLGLRIERRA